MQSIYERHMGPVEDVYSPYIDCNTSHIDVHTDSIPNAVQRKNKPSYAARGFAAGRKLNP